MMNAYLVKPRRRNTRTGKVRESKFWAIRYKLDGCESYKDRNLRVRDKQVAQAKLNEFVRECEREAAGLVVPKTLRDAAAKTLAVHLGDFTADLRARQRSRMYVHNVDKRATKLLAACGWTLPRDVTADSFTAWRAQQTKAPKTLNDYLDVANALLNWMQRCGRIIANPLASVGKVQTAGKEVRVRRAFTDRELGQLLAVAGPRRTLYLTALHTGLRRNELRSLLWGDVHLDAVKPFLRVRASTTKNGKGATIWVRDDLAADLAAFRPADAMSGDRVFPLLTRKLDAFKLDLEAAKIPFKVDGRQADFHSLRHTLGTIMARHNVGPRVAMDVMRHSDMRLTVRYTDASQLPTAEALEHLPRFDMPAVESLRATGTTDDLPCTENDTQNDTQLLVQRGLLLSSGVSCNDSTNDQNRSETPSESASLALAVQSCHEGGKNWGTRIRT
jgi:integrase